MTVNVPITDSDKANLVQILESGIEALRIAQDRLSTVRIRLLCANPGTDADTWQALTLPMTEAIRKLHSGATFVKNADSFLFDLHLESKMVH